MAKLPALQFYPGDWRKDPGVQALDYEHRGVWFELLMLMHESPSRGRLVFHNCPMPDDAIANLLGLPEAKWKQIRSKLEAYGVASLDESGAIICRRMVRDEEIRQARAEAGRKGGLSSKREAKQEAKRGSSVSSSVSSSSSEEATRATSDKLSEWLGEDYRGCLNGVEDYTQRSIYGLYGPNGTDEGIWDGLEAERRPPLLSKALLRLYGERETYNGRFFRRILETVVQETRRPPTGSEASQHTHESETEREEWRRRRAAAKQAEADAIARLNAMAVPANGPLTRLEVPRSDEDG